MIHIERIVEFWTDNEIPCAVDIARWYDGDAQAGYDTYAPFKAVATLVWYGDIVEIYGLKGKMDRYMYKFLELALVERGARKAFAMRHGKLHEWSFEEPEKEVQA